MRSKVKFIYFWVVAFSYMIFQTLKGRHWHMLFVDFETGEEPIGENGPVGRTKRKRLIAKRSASGVHLYWEDMSRYFAEVQA